MGKPDGSSDGSGQDSDRLTVLLTSFEEGVTDKMEVKIIVNSSLYPLSYYVRIKHRFLAHLSRRLIGELIVYQ